MTEQPDYTQPDPSPAKPKFAYLPTLDGWRAVAIIMVLCSHGADSLEYVLGKRSLRLAIFLDEYGRYGVQIFFALSGFLICSRLLVERQQRGRISLKQFYQRRVFRILPASMLFLLVAGLLSLLQVVSVPIRSWLIALATFSNYVRPTTWYIGHYWSLAVEEHFYMLWPGLVVLLAGWRRGLAGAVVLALLVAAWRFWTYKWVYYTSYATFSSRTDLQADCLLWGCAIAFLYVDESARSWMTKILRPVPWMFVLALAIVVALHNPADWKVRQFESVVLRILIPMVIVGTVLHSTSIVGRVLESKPMRLIGWLSYSLYLWQQLFVVPRDARVPALGVLQAFPWNVVTAFICAAASYRLVEQPMIRLGHHLTKPAKMTPKAQAVATLPPNTVQPEAKIPA